MLRNRVWQQAFERLERPEGKLSWAVLRGLEVSNDLRLPDHIDEDILARAFWTRHTSIWQSAQDGLVLYAMVWKPLLANAVALMVLSYVPFIVAFILFVAPVGALLFLISPQLAGWGVLFALVLAFFVKLAVGDAFAMTAMVAAYLRETADLEPDPAISAQLDRVTDKFGELKRRAQGAAPAKEKAPD
jgi:hypothetical protein